MIMITTGILLSATINYNFVEYKNISALEEYNNNEKFVDNNKEKYKDISTWSPKLVEEKRLDARAEFIAKQQNKSIETLFDTITWFLTALLFLLIHIYIYRKYPNSD
jgi:hypothetical protein